MAAPSTAAPGTTAEVQSLRGRCLQLEAELAAALNPTHTVTFIGSCEGWHGHPLNLGNAGPTAHMQATTELTKWKTANPNAVILSEEYTWYGLVAQVRPDNLVFMAPTLFIVVKHRLC